jgi:asparagine synthase (glutamine-hydrolysing)
LRADVEVGSCLSGGIDSSSIVSIIHQTGHTGLNTFTAAFNEAGIDESNWAKIVADYTKCNAHWVKPTAQELVKDLRDLIYCQDIPIWSTSTYAQYRVMQMIKQSNIKVVLDGQGGDELFAGYENYFLPDLKDEMLHHGMNGFATEAKLIGDQYPSYKGYIKQLMREKYFAKISGASQLKLRLSKHKEVTYLKKDFVEAHTERLKMHTDKTESLNKTLYHDFCGTLLKGYLKCEDRCSMWHSVESRTPFSDDINLIEHVFSIPSSYKIQGGRLKALMRDAMQGITPQQILDRKDKKGYKTPNRQWISQIREEVKYIFEAPIVKEYVDTEKLLKEYDVVFNQPNAEDNGRIFKLIAFPMWLTVFSGKS